MKRCVCSGRENKRRNWRILAAKVKVSYDNDIAVKQDKAVVQCRICRSVWHTNLTEGLKDVR